MPHTETEMLNQVEIIEKYLKNNQFITGKKAKKLLSTTRGYATFLLCSSPEFQKFYRNPANVSGRKRLSWKLA